MRRLIGAVQDLSHARTLEAVVSVVRCAARELTGADGASFILRDGEQCYYLDEDAIGPLWKGQRFPMTACVSGWAMMHRQAAVIPNIYCDPRVPVDAYRPTFVKSLVMVPIRTVSPIGAIGNYWAHEHQATEEEVELLQALANTTAVALENVQLYSDLENRVRDRTVELEDTIRELEAFSYSVSHDLRGPLSVLTSSADMLEHVFASSVAEPARKYVSFISQATHGMSRLLDDLLRLARLARTDLKLEDVDLGLVAKQIADQASYLEPRRKVEIRIQSALTTIGDAGLLKVVLDNLISNAWKYTSKQDHAIIEMGRLETAENADTFFIRDNGIGFDMTSASKLFIPFQRLHSDEDFQGYGIGLATAQRVIHRHGGHIWAEAEEGKGATFFFSLPKASLLKAASQ